MYELIVSILVWLSADPAQVNTVAPRAASCSSAAYATMVRQELTDDEDSCNCDEQCEGQCDGNCCESCECEVETAGGGEPPASVKKRVVRCVNGRCYITYE